MMRGEVITDGWKSDEVHSALDLCLSCKGCKAECPVNVDIATYKAEFNAALTGRGGSGPGRRTRSAGSAGGRGPHRSLRARWRWRGGWSRSRGSPRPPRGCTPRGRCRSSRSARFGSSGRGRASQRTGARRGRRIRRGRPTGGAPGGRGKVIFWPDTFSNHFHPEAGLAAVRGARGARLRGGAAARAALLRATALRLRLPRDGQTSARTDPRRARGGHARGRAGGGRGAVLRVHLPRRAAQPVPADQRASGSRSRASC